MKARVLLGSLLLLLFLLAAGTGMAMSSTTYRLDWFVPLTGGGGGRASSVSYAANLTIGQPAIGPGASTGYGAGLGYWYGVPAQWPTYLPLVLRN